MTWRMLKLVAAWSVMVVVLLAVTVAVLVPRLAGATPYTVLTDSMRPALPPGTLVVARPVPFEQIGIGDVITYQVKSGQPEVVTHRVVSIGMNGERKRVLQTKGDANNSADARGVVEQQVRGRAWYAVPVLGRVSNLITGQQRNMATGVIAAGLLGYAGFMMVSAARGRRRSHAFQEG